MPDLSSVTDAALSSWQDAFGLLTSRLGTRAPQHVQTIGNVATFSQPDLAFLCSIKCPGDVILMAYDTARMIRDAGISVIGGFQSPMEQECFDLLIRGGQPIVLALARSAEGMRMRAEWQNGIESGRLCIVSFCEPTIRRPTAQTAEYRNECITALAEQVLIAHASLGGKLDRLARRLLATGRKVLTFDCAANAELIAVGAEAIIPGEVERHIRPRFFSERRSE